MRPTLACLTALLAGSILAVAASGVLAAPGLSQAPAGAQAPVSLARVLAVFALGCLMAVGAALLLARLRAGAARSGAPGPAVRGLFGALGAPGTQHITADGLVHVSSRFLPQGACAHHLRTGDTHWLAVTGPAGVAVVLVPSGPAVHGKTADTPVRAEDGP